LSLLEIIDRVTRKIAPGPAPSFNEAHVVKAIELICERGSVGRILLSRELGLGEGTTRTLLKHLKNEAILKTSRTGISLSEEGKKLFSNLRSKISACSEVPNSPLTVGSCNIAVLIRNAAKAVGSGMEQRDIAIQSGATGATTLIFYNNKLLLPTGEKNISESKFNADALSKMIGMSRMQLYRKVRGLTDQTVHEFIRSIRLKRAVQLLRSRRKTITEIAYEVGFNDLTYFARCFRKQYRKSPSEFISEKN